MGQKNPGQCLCVTCLTFSFPKERNNQKFYEKSSQKFKEKNWPKLKYLGVFIDTRWQGKENLY